MHTYLPYVYRFTQVSTGKWYVGVRHRKGCHPNDGYNSSSKVVRPLIESCSDDWIKEIVATGSKEAMIELEQFILEELNAAQDPMSFNMHNSNGKFHNAGHSEETRRKMRRKLPEETRRKMSIAKKGVPMSEEHRRKVRLARTGHKRSEETRQKIRESQQARRLRERAAAHGTSPL